MSLQHKPTPPVDDLEDGGVATIATGRAFRLIDFAPVVLGVLFVLAMSLSWLQVWHPFIEHDDWDAILPVEPARRGVAHQRLLWEGRPLNYAWWLVGGHALTTVTAALLYELSYLAFVVRVAWRWAPGWLSLPVVVALFGSPMIAETLFWPATLGVSMVILAIAAWTLPLCSGRRNLTAGWIVVMTGAAFLAYPPACLLIFVLLVVELIDARFRHLVAATVLFGVSYVAAALSVFAMNLYVFGKFGLEVRAWRKPNPLRDFHSLEVNARRYWLQLDRLVTLTTIPFVIGVCALVACIAMPTLRQRGARLALALVIFLGVEGGTTLLTGVNTAYRGSPWVWPVLIVPLIWIARARPRLHPGAVRAVAVLALVVVGVWGIRYWRVAIDYNQHRLALYDKVETKLAKATQQFPSDFVVIYGDAGDWQQPAFTQEAQYLSQRALDAHGTKITNCHPPTCDLPRRPDVVRQLRQGRQVIHTPGYILVVPPSHVRPHGDRL